MTNIKIVDEVDQSENKYYDNNDHQDFIWVFVDRNSELKILSSDDESASFLTFSSRC